MEEKIRKFLIENAELIQEEIEDAAKESFTVSESGGYDEKISVVLTDDFLLETIVHPSSYWYPTYIIYVLCSFDCETYTVEYDDVRNFLTKEQAAKFEKSLLDNAEHIMKLENDDLKEFEELDEDDQLSEVLYYIYENSIVLELFEEFDKNLYEQFLKNIYDEADTSFAVDFAMDNLFNNLHEYEDYN